MQVEQEAVMRVILATSLWTRLRGLLSRKVCANGETLLLVPCRSIHSFGMTDELDIAFISADSRVLAAERNLPKHRLRSQSRAVAVLERRSRPEKPWPQAGDRLNLSFACKPAAGLGQRERTGWKAARRGQKLHPLSTPRKELDHESMFKLWQRHL